MDKLDSISKDDRSDFNSTQGVPSGDGTDVPIKIVNKMVLIA